MAVQDGNYEQVGFYFKYTIPDEETGKIKTVYVPQYMLMAEHCLAEKSMAFDDSVSYKFDGKKWGWLSKNELQKHILAQNPEGLKPFHIDQFIKVIRANCFIGAMGFKDTDGKVNVDNGIVDIASGALEMHSYQYLFKYCIPMKYEQSAECPKWLRFLDNIFEGNQELISLAQKLFGYTLMGGHPFLHRAFVLYGTGRNGKSTFLDVLRALVGKGSYSTVSMAKLDKEFSLVNLDGKLANIVEETPTDEINSEIFKALVGGGEVQVAHKGHDEFTLRVNARFIFACNDMPIFKDKSIGLLDRLVFIPFKRYFAENERDTKITQKLLAELPGILNWSIKGAKTLISEGNLGIAQASEDTKETYQEETDPLYAWFKRAFKITADNLFDASKDVTAAQVYEKYKVEMEECGHRPYSREKFFRRFRLLVKRVCLERSVAYDENHKWYNVTDGKQHRAFNVLRCIASEFQSIDS